jgi:ClpP class serine protease
VTLIKAGKFKAETNPFEPLSDEAQRGAAGARRRVLRHVRPRRREGPRRQRRRRPVNGFGEGRIVTAKNALAGGMVDRVDTFEATVRG